MKDILTSENENIQKGKNFHTTAAVPLLGLGALMTASCPPSHPMIKMFNKQKYLRIQKRRGGFLIPKSTIDCKIFTI
jgi:hypothetical protein